MHPRNPPASCILPCALRAAATGILLVLGMGGMLACGAASSGEGTPAPWTAPETPLTTAAGTSDAYGEVVLAVDGGVRRLRLLDEQTGVPIAGARVLCAKGTAGAALLVLDPRGVYPGVLTGLASPVGEGGGVTAGTHGGAAAGEVATTVRLSSLGRMHGRHDERGSDPAPSDPADEVLREAEDDGTLLEVGTTTLDGARAAFGSWFQGVLAQHPDPLLVSFGYADGTETAWVDALLDTGGAPAQVVAEEARRRYAAACQPGDLRLTVFAFLERGVVLGLRLLPDRVTTVPSGGQLVTIRGTVTDAVTGAPLSGARVEVTYPVVAHVVTDVRGIYSLDNVQLGCRSAAEVTLVVSKAGYGTRVLEGSELGLRQGVANTVNVALSPPLVLRGATPALVPAADLPGSPNWTDCPALPTADFGEAVDVELLFEGGTAPYRVELLDDPFDLEDGTLPMGVLVHPQRAAIVGSPLSYRTDGWPERLTFRVSDADGATLIIKLQWRIRAP